MSTMEERYMFALPNGRLIVETAFVNRLTQNDQMPKMTKC
jgi:hypothetical protein